MSKTITASQDVLSRDVRGETVLLNQRTEHYFGLSGVGARIWQLISAGRSLDDVRAAIVAEYDIDAETLNKDLDRFVGDLASAGLVATTKS